MNTPLTAEHLAKARTILAKIEVLIKERDAILREVGTAIQPYLAAVQAKGRKNTRSVADRVRAALSVHTALTTDHLAEAIGVKPVTMKSWVYTAAGKAVVKPTECDGERGWILA